MRECDRCANGVRRWNGVGRPEWRQRRESRSQNGKREKTIQNQCGVKEKYVPPPAGTHHFLSLALASMSCYASCC